nr:ribonuclease H-like domain-containing protein [Tanacetum cinerariifolium]
IGATSTNTKMVYSDQPSYSSLISYTPIPAGSIMEDVLHFFVAENEPTQQLAYEDFKQVDQMEMKKLDIKWQMTMLSLRINKFQKKAVRKINFNNKDSARFDRRKARCYNFLQLEHFARECNVKKVDEKAMYFAFKISEVKIEELKAMSDFAVPAGNAVGGVNPAAAEFSMMGISPKVDQMEMKKLDIKWQMTMLSLRINKFQKKAVRKINFNNKDSTRFDRRKARCYNFLQLEHFARECNVKKVDEKA